MPQTMEAVFYIFSSLGLIDTVYLSYHAIKKTDVACWFFPKEWCRKVQYSEYSKTFGIPNSYLGLMMYAGILVLTTYTVIGILPAWIVKTVVALGFLFSMYFTFIQAFVLRAFCTWCVVSAVNFTVMFIFLFVR